jgi:hypothetical protein
MVPILGAAGLLAMVQPAAAIPNSSDAHHPVLAGDASTADDGITAQGARSRQRCNPNNPYCGKSPDVWDRWSLADTDYSKSYGA